MLINIEMKKKLKKGYVYLAHLKNTYKVTYKVQRIWLPYNLKNLYFALLKQTSFPSPFWMYFYFRFLGSLHRLHAFFSKTDRLVRSPTLDSRALFLLRRLVGIML